MSKYEEAINTLRKNYPPENYTMLRDAIDLAIEVLQEKSEEQD